MSKKTKMSVWLMIGELREIETQLRQFHTKHAKHHLPIQPNEWACSYHYHNKDFRRILRLAKKLDKFCRGFEGIAATQLEYRTTTENLRYMRDVMSVYDEQLEEKMDFYMDNNLDYGDRNGLKKQIRRVEKILYKLPSYSKITDMEVA